MTDTCRRVGVEGEVVGMGHNGLINLYEVTETGHAPGQVSDPHLEANL